MTGETQSRNRQGEEKGGQKRKEEKGRGGVARMGAEKGVEILDRGNHERSEKGKGRGGPRKGWKAGGDARRNPAREWGTVQQVRKDEAGPRGQGFKRARMTEVTSFDDAGVCTLCMPA